MALFFPEDNHPQKGRKVGFDRYREVLERDWKRFMASGLITLISFVPFGVGMFFAVATESALLMLPLAALGGVIAGPFLYGFYDLMYRSLRDAHGSWWFDYWRAIRKNWRCALVPGAVLGLFLGITGFMAMMLFYWSAAIPGWGTVLMALVSTLFVTMILSVYWPQLVLFEQTNAQRLRNCVLFCAKYLWQALGAAAIQVGYYALVVLLMPWSAFVLPLSNIWIPGFWGNFILYPKLNEAFDIESAIEAAFPGQMAHPGEEEEV